jgi:hypothetical protein
MNLFKKIALYTNILIAQRLLNLVKCLQKTRNPSFLRVKEIHMSLYGGPVKVRSPTPDVTDITGDLHRLVLDSRPQRPAPMPPQVVSRTAPAVQRAYTQVDFERENEAFEKVYTANRIYPGLKIYFSEAVYDAADSGTEQCLMSRKSKNPEYVQLSLVETHEIIRVLNQCLRDPLRRLGKNPSDQQIQVIYERVMSLSSFLEREQILAFNRAGYRRRVHNLVDAFYRLECLKIAKWLVKSRKVASLQDASTLLFDPSKLLSLNPQGSFAEAIGCEVMMQNERLHNPSSH